MTLLFTVGGRFTICYQGHGFSNIITGCFRSLTGFKQRALHGRGRTDRRAEGTLTLLPSAEATGNGTRKGLISSYLLSWEFPGCPAVRALTARVPTLVEKLRSPALRAGGKKSVIGFRKDQQPRGRWGSPGETGQGEAPGPQAPRACSSPEVFHKVDRVPEEVVETVRVLLCCGDEAAPPSVTVAS